MPIRHALLVALFAVACAAGPTDESDAGTDAGSTASASTDCSAFPKTVTMGPSISSFPAAILCVNAEVTTCRLTTNTYSEGEGACANADTLANFSQNSDNDVFLQNGWTFESATAGTIVLNATGLNGVPTGTATTAVVKSSGGVQKKLVFTFDGGGSLTFTSYGAP